MQTPRVPGVSMPLANAPQNPLTDRGRHRDGRQCGLRRVAFLKRHERRNRPVEHLRGLGLSRPTVLPHLQRGIALKRVDLDARDARHLEPTGHHAIDQQLFDRRGRRPEPIGPHPRRELEQAFPEVQVRSPGRRDPGLFDVNRQVALADPEGRELV